MKQIDIGSVKRNDEAGTTHAQIKIGDIDIDVFTYDTDNKPKDQQRAEVERVLTLFRAMAYLMR